MSSVFMPALMLPFPPALVDAQRERIAKRVSIINAAGITTRKCDGSGENRPSK